MQNEEIESPDTRAKLLAIVTDAQKKTFMDLELATTVDWGQSFIKATYLLEGDGPECFEIIQKVQAICPLSAFSFFSAEELEGLKAELPTYLAKATDVAPNLQLSGLVESV